VVYGADGVVLNMGRRQRLFNGPQGGVRWFV